MSYTLLSTEPARDYEQFVLECMDNLREYRVKGIAVAALVTEGNENMTVTGYWHLSASGKMVISGEIELDAVDDMILTNIDRYRDYDPEEED
ncbi:MAG: hypothetical protein IKK78_00045 [Oscillospiraceae bacterium]|nr:hypothetical protein [Oscillospiraceae bacterium]